MRRHLRKVWVDGTKLRPGLPQTTPCTEAISDMGRDVFIQQVKDLFAG
jgi:hypothetical protein